MAELTEGWCWHCKFLESWVEAPGKSMMECHNPKARDCYGNVGREKGKPCPYWEEPETKNCAKHGEYYSYPEEPFGCPDCQDEIFEQFVTEHGY